jgi:Ca2+-binding EF-hand superfamily protein
MDLDVGKDGYITASDLRHALGRFSTKIEVREIKEIIRAVEHAPHHKINYSQFLMATVNLREELTENKLFDVFQFFDTQGSGFVSVHEL